VFRPRLPDTLRGLRFRVLYQGRRLEVDVGTREVRYRLLEGEEVSIWHYGTLIPLKAGADQHRDIPPVEFRSAPTQPPGREPRRRHRR